LPSKESIVPERFDEVLLLEVIDEKPFCCCCCCCEPEGNVIVEDNNVTWLDSSIGEYSGEELFKQ
jgi:hypothetical protein